MLRTCSQDGTVVEKIGLLVLQAMPVSYHTLLYRRVEPVGTAVAGKQSLGSLSANTETKCSRGRSRKAVYLLCPLRQGLRLARWDRTMTGRYQVSRLDVDSQFCHPSENTQLFPHFIRKVIPQREPSTCVPVLAIPEWQEATRLKRC